MTKVRALSACILLTGIASCMNSPVFTVEIYRTPTLYQAGTDAALGSPTAYQTIIDNSLASPTSLAVTNVVVSTPTAMPDSGPTFTPTAGIMPPDFSPIVYGKKFDADTFFILLGGVQGETWLTSDKAAAQVGGTVQYDVHTFAKGSYQVYGYAPEFSPTSQEYFLSTDETLNEFGMIGVAHGWPVRQVVAQELSADNEIYQNVVLDWLKENGLPKPELDTLRIFRVDLEGDGVDEIFISATHLDESQHTTQSGDYSVVLMRKVVGNDAVTLLIAGDIYHSQELEITYPRTYLPASFIDLNRDGVLEVVVDFQQWENAGALIYQVTGQDILKVP